MIWVFFIGGLAITALTAAPLGIGLALSGLLVLHFLLGGASNLGFIAVWNVFNEFTLSAVPLYILMGEILLRSGVSYRVYEAFSPLFRFVPGQLLHTNIAVCTLFSAVSGASMSTAAAVGTVAYPELARRGYHRPFVVGTLAAGGTLGLLIPPSLGFIIYGATQGVSITALFMAGIVPGLMLALMFSAIIAVTALLQPEKTPRRSDDQPPDTDRLRRLVGIWPLFALIFCVLGTIYLGLATPTEAAGLGVIAAIAIGAFWGDLRWPQLVKAFYGATRTFGAVMFVALGALVLAQAFSALGIPRDVMRSLTEMNLSATQVLIGMVLIYIVLGCFFDGLSLLLMTVPVVFPVMTGFGFDPVWLGVVIVVCIEIGMLTPPVGANLFVLCGITKGEVSISQAAVAALPFWFAMLVGVALLATFPQIALFLPGSGG